MDTKVINTMVEPMGSYTTVGRACVIAYALCNGGIKAGNIEAETPGGKVLRVTPKYILHGIGHIHTDVELNNKDGLMFIKLAEDISPWYMKYLIQNGVMHADKVKSISNILKGVEQDKKNSAASWLYKCTIDGVSIIRPVDGYVTVFKQSNEDWVAFIEGKDKMTQLSCGSLSSHIEDICNKLIDSYFVDEDQLTLENVFNKMIMKSGVHSVSEVSALIANALKHTLSDEDYESIKGELLDNFT